MDPEVVQLLTALFLLTMFETLTSVNALHGPASQKIVMGLTLIFPLAFVLNTPIITEGERLRSICSGPLSQPFTKTRKLLIPGRTVVVAKPYVGCGIGGAMRVVERNFHARHAMGRSSLRCIVSTRRFVPFTAGLWGLVALFQLSIKCEGLNFF